MRNGRTEREPSLNSNILILWRVLAPIWQRFAITSIRTDGWSNIISLLLFLHLSQMARQIDVGWLRFYLNWWMRISLCNAVVRNLHMLIYLLYWLWIRINDEGHKARCIIHRTFGPIFFNLKTFLLTKSKALFLILNWTWFSFKILLL